MNTAYTLTLSGGCKLMVAQLLRESVTPLAKNGHRSATPCQVSMLFQIVAWVRSGTLAGDVMHAVAKVDFHRYI